MNNKEKIQHYNRTHGHPPQKINFLDGDGEYAFYFGCDTNHNMRRKLKGCYGMLTHVYDIKTDTKKYAIWLDMRSLNDEKDEKIQMDLLLSTLIHEFLHFLMHKQFETYADRIGHYFSKCLDTPFMRKQLCDMIGGYDHVANAYDEKHNETWKGIGKYCTDKLKKWDM